MIDMAVAFALGVLASLVASHFWELIQRSRLKNQARALEGIWMGYHFVGREIDSKPMAGSGETRVESKEWRFGSRSGVLQVKSEDLDVTSGRPRYHSGYIVLDRHLPWTARRIDRYDEEHEVSEQRMILTADPDVIYIFPDKMVASANYGAHAWRRTRRL
jgi:hypothetical protein